MGRVEFGPNVDGNPYLMRFTEVFPVKRNQNPARFRRRNKVFRVRLGAVSQIYRVNDVVTVLS